jgi:DNA replication and repair protein RecF
VALIELEVTDFRCIRHTKIALDARCNVLVGGNASGKTSLLESIHVLSCGHAFGIAQLNSLVRHKSVAFQVVGRVISDSATKVLGIRGTASGVEARVAGERVKSLSELAAHLPVQVIDPGIHHLLEDGPRLRRRFIDWGVFHVEPGFIDAHRRYGRALRQRNAALKARLAPAAISSWDPELVAAGGLITSYRAAYIKSLEPIVAAIGRQLLGDTVRIDYQSGINNSNGFAAALAAAWDKDIRYGQSTVGPHRADLAIQTSGLGIKNRISRGQQKLLACTLVLAQLHYRMTQKKGPATLLLDDPAAELDGDNLAKLLDLIATTPAQLVMATANEHALERFSRGRKFHVEQGQITAML